MAERSRAAEDGAPRQVLTAKISNELRGKLDRAAKNRGRTLSREVEQRLEDSFGTTAGGPHAQLLTCVQAVLEEVESLTGGSILDRDGNQARTTTRRALKYLIEAWCGPDEGEPEVYESALKPDGTPMIPDLNVSRNIAMDVLRRERLLKPHKGGGYYLSIGYIPPDD